MKKTDLKNYLTIYMPTAPYMFVYMLQQVEYSGVEFIKWVNRGPDYRKVMHRKKLVLTKKALVLLAMVYGLAAILLAVVMLLLIQHIYPLAVGIFIALPAFLVLFLAYINRLGKKLLAFKRRKDIGVAASKLAANPAKKIVVIGSYGKTTAKELLTTVLSEGKKVAATPGNMNVAISHARWVNTKLTGEEEILIFECGEENPGDIKRFAEFVKPDIAVVTGYAPNHIESYGSVEALKADLTSIEQYVKPENLFVAEQAAQALPFSKKVQTFGPEGSGKWHIKDVNVKLSGTSFELTQQKDKVKLHTNLIGEHVVPVLALCFDLGLSLGIGKKELETGVEKTVPFEHRMQATFVNGAWLVDDTYNGNLEGIRAGLKLLSQVEAARKIYVTPGLVEQGSETEKVHEEIGKLIAEAKPDVTVLMHNSVCHIIESSLKHHGYKGELRIEPDPLHFYQNINYEIAAGDVVMMQNDWTDNYS